MFYQLRMAVPANTSADEPTRGRLDVHPGITQKVWVGFPPGPANRARAVIRHHGTQIWPTSQEEYFGWDDYVWAFEDRYPVVAEPYRFIVEAWNSDPKYDHIVLFAVTIEPQPPRREVNSLLRLMQELGLA